MKIKHLPWIAVVAGILMGLAIREVWADLWLKQSTAVTVKLGPFLDEDDGKTAETGLTITQADVRLTKNGGNIAQKNESGALTHDELGVYDCNLDTTDTGTLGRLKIFIHESGAGPVWEHYMVVPANVWDSYFSTDKLQVDVNQVTGNAVPCTTAQLVSDGSAAPTNFSSLGIDSSGFVDVNLDGTTGTLDAAEIGANAITSAKIASGAIDADSIAASAIGASEIATGAIDADSIAANAIGDSEFDATVSATTDFNDLTDMDISDKATKNTVGWLLNLLKLFSR